LELYFEKKNVFFLVFILGTPKISNLRIKQRICGHELSVVKWHSFRNQDYKTYSRETDLYERTSVLMGGNCGSIARSKIPENVFEGLFWVLRKL